MTKTEIINRLRDLQVDTVLAIYSGGPSQGGSISIDYMVATFTSGRLEEQDPNAHWPKREVAQSAHYAWAPRTEAQETARVWGAIAEVHGHGNLSIECNINGTILVDVKKDTITITTTWKGV